MSDTSLNKFFGQGDDAVEGAFTPDPPTGLTPEQAVFFVNDQTPASPVLKWWNGAAFVTVGGGSGTVTNTGTLTSGKTIIGNGSTDVTVSSLTATVVKSSSGTMSAASAGTDYVAPGGALGTPSSGTLTNCTGLPLTTGVTGVLPGANGGGLVRLAQITTSSSATSVDFNTISGSYQALRVVWIAQNGGAGTSDVAMNLMVNNDSTSGNYTSAGQTGVLNGSALNGNIAAASSGARVGTLAQSGTTGSSSAGEVLIPGYAQTTFHKRIIGQWAEDTTTTGIFVARTGFRWKSTSAITRLTFAASDGTAFTDGSIFTLYGCN